MTNVNQSAAWARTLSRDASTGIDAVYFNPAGVGKLKKGFHLSLSNQSIFQTRQVTSDYTYLNDTPNTYEAELTAPLFPSVYAAYKLEKLAISAGFNIIGGGGSANYKTGLPSFEVPASSVVPLIQGAVSPIDPSLAAISYSMNASFEGSSKYMGFQLGATYAINDIISVALGARYVSAKNTYDGSLTDYMINPPTDLNPAFAAVIGADPMRPGAYMNAVSQIYYAGTGDSTGMLQLQGAGAQMDARTADQTLSTVQTGWGITPIVGVNISLLDMVNIGIKYEHHTKIEMTNETTSDVYDANLQGMYPDGAKSRADLPGMFALGVHVKPIKKLTASVGFNYFLDKTAYYGKIAYESDGSKSVEEDGISYKQVNNENYIDDNAYTISGSVEYRFLGIMGASVGFVTGNLGVNNTYQSDLSYALKSTSIGGGIFVELGEIITLNAGYVYSMYDDYTNSELSYQPTGFPQAVPYNDTYGKKTSLFAIGIDISL